MAACGAPRAAPAEAATGSPPAPGSDERRRSTDTAAALLPAFGALTATPGTLALPAATRTQPTLIATIVFTRHRHAMSAAPHRSKRDIHTIDRNAPGYGVTRTPVRAGGATPGRVKELLATLSALVPVPLVAAIVAFMGCVVNGNANSGPVPVSV